MDIFAENVPSLQLNHVIKYLTQVVISISTPGDLLSLIKPDKSDIRLGGQVTVSFAEMFVTNNTLKF